MAKDQSKGKQTMLGILDKISGFATPTRVPLWDRKKAPDKSSIVDGTRKLEYEGASKEKSIQALLDVLGIISGPGAVAKVSTAAMMGAITPFGKKSFTTIHNTEPHQLVKLLEESADKGVKPTLDALSFAITERAPLRQFGEVSMVLNPKVLNPKNNPNVILHNRDVYTARASDIRAGNKTYEELKRGGVKRTESATPEDSHLLAIDLSPRFSSFEQWEKSAAGSGVLGRKYAEQSRALLELVDDYASIFPDLYTRKGYQFTGDRYLSGAPKLSVESYAQFLTDQAKNGDKKAIAMMHYGKILGSDYAEGKILTPFEVNADNVVGAVLLPTRRKSNAGARSAVEIELEKLGIMAGEPKSLMSDGLWARFNTLASMKATTTLDKMEKLATKNPAGYFNAAPGSERAEITSMLSTVDGGQRDFTGANDLMTLFRDLRHSNINSTHLDNEVRNVFTENIFASDNAVEAVMQQLLPPSFFAK